MPLVNSEVSKIMDAFGKSRFESMYLRVGKVELNLKKADPVTASVDPETVNSDKESSQTKKASLHGISSVKDEKIEFIKSPLMGVIRLAQAFNEPPFVKAGAEVEPLDVVALIDVLGTLSKVESGYKGRITKVCCDADQLVEYQQDLFQIEISRWPDGQMGEKGSSLRWAHEQHI